MSSTTWYLAVDKDITYYDRWAGALIPEGATQVRIVITCISDSYARDYAITKGWIQPSLPYPCSDPEVIENSTLNTGDSLDKTYDVSQFDTGKVWVYVGVTAEGYKWHVKIYFDAEGAEILEVKNVLPTLINSLGDYNSGSLGNGSDPGDYIAWDDDVCGAVTLFFRYYGGKQAIISQTDGTARFKAWSDAGNNGHTGINVRHLSTAVTDGWKQSNSVTPDTTRWVGRIKALVNVTSGSAKLEAFSDWNITDDVPWGTIKGQVTSTTTGSDEWITLDVNDNVAHYSVRATAGDDFVLKGLYVEHKTEQAQPPQPESLITKIEELKDKITNWTDKPLKAMVGAMLGIVTLDDVIAMAQDTSLPAYTRLQYVELARRMGADETTITQLVQSLSSEFPNICNLPGTNDCGLVSPPCFATTRRLQVYLLPKYDSQNWDYKQMLSSLEGKSPFLELDSSGGIHSIDYGPRWYDESMETCDVYLKIARLALENDDGTTFNNALSEANRVWDWINSNLWTGDHYKYALNWSDYECEVSFHIIAARLKVYNGGSITNEDRILTDIYNRLLVNGLGSPQWKNNTPVLMHHNPDNSQGRFTNTLPAFYVLHLWSPLMDSTSLSKFQEILDTPAWQKLFESTVYDSSTGMFKWTDDASEVSEEATATAIFVLLLMGIKPIDGFLYLPIIENGYEDKLLWTPMIKLDLTNKKLTIPVKAGTLEFMFGTTPVQYTFSEDGVYEVQFSDDWNSITSATKISDPDPSYYYIDSTVTAPGVPHFTITQYTDSVTVNPGDTFGVDWTVVNDGDASDTFTIELLDHNGTVVDSYTHPTALDPSGSATGQLSGTAPSEPGTYTWKLQVKTSSGTVTDQKNVTVNVVQPSTPHFTITSYTSEVSVEPGGTITVQAVVKNDGDASGMVTVRLFDHNNTLMDAKDANIAPNNTTMFTLTATAPSQPGTYTWRLDAYNNDTGNIDDEKTITVNVQASQPAPSKKTDNTKLLLLIGAGLVLFMLSREKKKR